MANIFDGLEKAPQQELVNLTATFDVYNPGNEVKVLFKRIGNFFKWLFKIYYRPVSMSCEFENRKKDLSGVLGTDIFVVLKHSMRRALFFTGKLSTGKSDDRLSVCTINALTHIYKGPQYKYMSPAEKADELKRKCYLRNANRIKRLPVIWLILTILILIGAIVCGCAFLPWKIVLPSAFGLELVFYLFFKRRLAFEKLSRTMALSGKYLGQIFSVPIDELSIRKKENGGDFERGLRALHSIEIRMQENSQKKEELEVEKKEFSDSLQQVEGSLRKYSEDRFENGMDINDLRNIEKELLLDRDRLNDEITQANITISELSNKQNEDKNLYEKLNNKLLTDIRDYWSERYNMFGFGDGFYTKLVQGFEWHSFDVIEKRLIELASMDDPTAIGKKKAGFYRFNFGIRGKLCRLLYAVKGKDINISNLERETPVSDVGMSEREIHDTLELYGIIREDHTDKELIEDLVKQKRATEEKLASVQNAYVEIRDRLSNVEIDLNAIKLERESLKRDVDKHKRALIAVQERNDLDNEKKSQLIAELQKRIKELEKSLDEKDREYNQVVAQFKAQQKQYEDSKRQLQEDVLHLNQLYERLDQAINNSEDEITTLTDNVHDSKNQNNFIESTLRQTGINSRKNSEAYEKLLSANKKQREEIAKKEEKIRELREKNRIAREEQKELKDLVEKIHAEIKKGDEELEKVRLENEELRKTLFKNENYENREIRNQFFDAIEKAKKEIDIISPWLGSMAESRAFLTRLDRAAGSGVKIKIRYGIGDDSGKNSNHKVSRTELKNLIESRVEKTGRDESELRSVRDIYYLHRRLDKIQPGCFTSKREDTHAKLLIVDNEFFMMGSFNFLSFLGKYDGTDNRTEIAIKSTDKKVLDTFYSRFFKFTKNEPAWITEDLGEPVIRIRD